MFLLPLLALGLVGFLIGSSRSEPTPPQRALTAGTAGAVAPGVPSPLVVLDSFLRAGQTPPPPVILCAIAQAEIMGDEDLVESLVRAFILPVVQAAEAAGAQSRLSSGPCFPGFPMPVPAPVADYGAPAAYAPVDPGGYPQQVAHPGDARVDLMPSQFVPPLPTQPTAPTPSPLPAAGPASPNAGTVTVSGRSSPIEGVGTTEWSQFVGRVSRELPEFTSSRHVGQFRQRVDRLRELGIDPDEVARSTDAQARALEADMADAYDHAVSSGLVAEYRGVLVDVPGPAGRGPVPVTLSGVLGVIQAAGLEGAVGWLEDPGDRERFPHTTQAFLRTNGVF